MKKFVLVLSLVAFMFVGFSASRVDAVSGETKMVLGAGGAAAGTALGIYLHRLAKKKSEQLDLLELFEKYTSQENFRGFSETDAKVAGLMAELKSSGLWDGSGQVMLDEKIAKLTRLWWLYTLLEGFCFGGTVVGGWVAVNWMYNWAVVKDEVVPVVSETESQPNGTGEEPKELPLVADHHKKELVKAVIGEPKLENKPATETESEPVEPVQAQPTNQEVAEPPVQSKANVEIFEKPENYLGHDVGNEERKRKPKNTKKVGGKYGSDWLSPNYKNPVAKYKIEYNSFSKDLKEKKTMKTIKKRPKRGVPGSNQLSNKKK
ncbi:hypothetical protein KKA53_02315 [Candidatus Dependentiae bacterium]|nr:hypothetical protein [Candidatus Dependentiae bacterium]